MFSFICAWINAWVSNVEACDLRRHPAHCDVTEWMWCLSALVLTRGHVSRFVVIVIKSISLIPRDWCVSLVCVDRGIIYSARFNWSKTGLFQANICLFLVCLFVFCVFCLFVCLFVWGGGGILFFLCVVICFGSFGVDSCDSCRGDFSFIAFVNITVALLKIIGQVRLGSLVPNYFSVRTILNSTGCCK